jgi:hypothetical protein
MHQNGGHNTFVSCTSSCWALLSRSNLSNSQRSNFFVFSGVFFLCVCVCVCVCARARLCVCKHESDRTNVDLPAPFSPITAQRLTSMSLQDTSFRSTGRSGRYEKLMLACAGGRTSFVCVHVCVRLCVWGNERAESGVQASTYSVDTTCVL